MIIQDFVLSLMLIMGTLMMLDVVRMHRRQKKFNRCLTRSNERRAEAFEALKKMDFEKCDLLMLVAQEELERAKELA